MGTPTLALLEWDLLGSVLEGLSKTLAPGGTLDRGLSEKGVSISLMLYEPSADACLVHSMGALVMIPATYTSWTVTCCLRVLMKSSCNEPQSMSDPGDA